MSSYAHRPAASGLHAKLRGELSQYRVRAAFNGIPDHVRVLRVQDYYSPFTVWSGHRDLMPPAYSGCDDPDGVLSRPASD